MRRNFYNKPLATFNWDMEISDRIELNTSLYASAGRGGGTGPDRERSALTVLWIFYLSEKI